MWKDPIVEELHRIRESMLAENGNDLAALARAANARATKLIRAAPLTPSHTTMRDANDANDADAAFEVTTRDEI